MPVIFEYLGIIISFYADEHDPIHVHAQYEGNEIKVEFIIDDGMVTTINYKLLKGKFSAAKEKQLVSFVEKYKNEIVHAWDDFFVWKKKIKKQIITSKI